MTVPRRRLLLLLLLLLILLLLIIIITIIITVAVKWTNKIRCAIFLVLSPLHARRCHVHCGVQRVWSGHACSPLYLRCCYQWSHCCRRLLQRCWHCTQFRRYELSYQEKFSLRMIFRRNERKAGIMKHDPSVHRSAGPHVSFPELLNRFRFNLYQNFYTMNFWVDISTESALHSAQTGNSILKHNLRAQIYIQLQFSV